MPAHCSPRFNRSVVRFHRDRAPRFKCDHWSPDGNNIAFATSTLGIATIRATGAQFRLIVSPTSNWTAIRPYWSTGSNFIAFTGQDGSPVNLDVWRVTATGSNLTDLTNRPAPFNEYIMHTFGGEDGDNKTRSAARPEITP